MSFNIRIPNITANSTAEQIRQVHSYLFQVVEQLNWALNNIETANVATKANDSATNSGNTQAPQEKPPIDTFNSIKGLIIKSADIVNAYYEEIDDLLKLSGEYVAEATFPEGSAKFIHNTNTALKANSDSISQFYTNMQEILSDIESLNNQLINVNAYIKSGLLYYGDDGVPIYGLEIGQKTDKNGVETFNQYARFVSNKLSFFDSNGYEAAYISDKKLFIDNVEINISFSMGGFVDTVRPDKSIVTKWTGGR